MILANRRSPGWTLLIYVFSMLIAGCASSKPGTTAATEAESEAPGVALYIVGSDVTSDPSSAAGMAHVIEPGVRFDGLYLPSQNNGTVLVSLVAGPTTRLALLSSDGALRTIHQSGPGTDYTGAWSQGGDLVFGFASPNGRGIRTLVSDGSVKDVGCSASSRAFAWVSPERLVVGNADNNYVVSTPGCATISRVDARKMHEMAFNPVNTTVAYILRELEYDRKARQYVPDSSLYIAGVDGSDPDLIVGDRYKPHRPSWSPNGLELAFDARLPDRPQRRLISIYDAEGSTSAFLNPSSVDGSISEWDAHWSPGGTGIAYMQRSGSASPLVVVRPMDGSFVSVVGESGEHFARWIDDAHLVVTDGTRERVVSTDGKASVEGPAGATILAMR